MKFLSFLLFPLFAFAQTGRLVEADLFKGTSAYQDYTKNGSCRNNTLNITGTGSGNTLDQNTAPGLDNGTACVIGLGATGNTYTFDTLNMSGADHNKNCEIKFTYFGDGTNYYVYATNIDGFTSTKVALKNATVPTEGEPIILPCGGTYGSSNQTAPKLKLEAISGSASGLRIARVTSTRVSSIGQFSAISDSQSYTATLSAGFGTVVTQGLRYRRVGDFIEVFGTFTTATVAASIGSISLPSGLVLDTSKISINNTTGNIGNVWGEYWTSGTHSGSIISAPATSTTVLYFGANQTGSSYNTPAASVSASVVASSTIVNVRFKVPIQGWSASQSAAAAAQTDFGPRIQTGITIGGTTSAPTKPTTTVSDKITYSRKAKYLIAEYDFSYTSNSGAAAGSGDYLYTLPAGLSFDPSFVSYFTTAGATLANNALTISTLPTTGWITANGSAAGPVVAYAYDATRFRVGIQQIYTNSGFQSSSFFRINDTSVQLKFTITVPIAGWEENQRAPTLIGSVTSNSVGAEAIERVSFGGASEPSSCTGTPCTAYRKSGGITSVTRTGTGAYSVNFPTGLFSATPTCLCSMSMISTNVFCGKNQAGTFSPTRFDLWILNSSTTLSDGAADIICMGPR